MIRRSRRALLGSAFVALVAALVSRPGSAARLRKLRLRIAATTAPLALAEFVRQTGLQVLFDFDAIQNHSTREVSGQLDAREALAIMFDGTGLIYEFINERTIAVRPGPPVTPPALSPSAPPASPAPQPVQDT